jgi:hypothetical protein
MRHLLALDLQLEVGLLLRADVDRDPNQLEKISVFVRQAAPPDDYPARPAVREKEAVFGLKRPMRRAGAIESGMDRGPFIGMDASAD